MTVELRHIILYHRKLVIWHVEIKIDITSERFELEPQIEYHIKSLTETHLSGKLQSDRSRLEFVRVSEYSLAKSTIFVLINVLLVIHLPFLNSWR